jgi:Na+/melibiose symporter-like transporter
MIFGFFLLIVSFYFLINVNLAYPILWLLTFSFLTYLGWSFIQVPYLSWSSMISEHYHEKTQLNSSRELFSIIGVLIALLLPYIFGISSSALKSLQVVYVVFLILIVPLFVLTLLKVKPRYTNKKSMYNFTYIINIYKTFPQIKKLQVAYFINNLANALPATLFLFFIKLVINEEDMSGMVLILYFFSGIIALPFWTLLSKKIGKKRTWVTSMILALSVFSIVPFLGEGDLAIFIFVSVVSGLSLGADMAFPTAMQADLTQTISKKHENITGILFGIWTMITKLALALAVGISFSILGLFDFVPQNPNSASLIVLSLLYGALPVVLKIISIYLLRDYKDYQLT